MPLIRLYEVKVTVTKPGSEPIADTVYIHLVRHLFSEPYPYTKTATRRAIAKAQRRWYRCGVTSDYLDTRLIEG